MLKRGKVKRKPTSLHTPQIIPRNEHTLSRSKISPNALRVLYRLHEAGFGAYLVGGCVRDLLLNQQPKDFDIATNAHPEEIRKLFRNCRLIGRRFRLAHVHFGREIVEVATFRAAEAASDSEHRQESQHGLLVRDNVYGTLEDDVWRRDFTVNALYYNIADFSIVDYTNGIVDLKNKQLRLIGDPETRYREDPVRILRALRFAAKLDFTLESATATPIVQSKTLLQHVPPARVFEEVLKLLLSGNAQKTLVVLQEYAIFELLFPQTDALLKLATSHAKKLIAIACHNTDVRIAEGKSINPAFILSAILWPPLQQYYQALVQAGQRPILALEEASQRLLKEEAKHVAIPRRLTIMMREIWIFQWKLEVRTPKRVAQLLQHPRFRAAYDFLLLRAQAGESVAELAEWWTQYQAANPEMRQELLKKAPVIAKKKPRKRRKKPAQKSV